MGHETLRVQAERLHESLRQLAEIGATPGGGVTRLALSDEDRAGRDQVKAWMTEAGLDVRVDDLGNIVGRRAGKEDLPPILLGSHCDSVRRGGRYDGALGVLGAIEVVRTLNDHGITTRHPIEVVNWTNEEGVRFEPAMLASGAVTGVFTRDYVYDRTDPDGLRFEDELRRIGYLGSEANRPASPAAYLELHIEQGPILEADGFPVGVVEGIVGITWMEVTVVGQSDHAGPSPMRLRRDALMASVQMMAQVEQMAREQDDVTVGTVGRVSVEPNGINTIPGKVVFSVDFRHPEPATLEALVERFQAKVAEIAESRGVTATVDRFWTSESTPFDPNVIAAVQEAADALGVATRRIWSGAGHDAKYLADVSPGGMIFVRTQGGLSHCEQEYATPEDIEAGTNVLLHATLRLAGD